MNPGTTYYYKASAVNAGGEGEQSDYASASTRVGNGISVQILPGPAVTIESKTLEMWYIDRKR
ncbi:MAG: fibronectin type III domain-containing protein [Treponema sp.]|nr:fibronectin type III domain-containing protein [Treponema sp.]